MTVVSRTYRLFPGQYGVIDPELAGATVLVVKREGTEYELNRVTAVAPGEREVTHDSGNGTLRFLNAGMDLTDPSLPYDVTERVFALFKY